MLRVRNLSYWTKKYGILFFTGFIIFLVSIIPLRLYITSLQAPQPQAILTLGGETEREVYTANFAKYYPELEIWVSTGIVPQEARTIFQTAGIADSRLHLDYQAIDTVTNFTTLVEEFKKRKIQHLYLITSDFHMPRAKAIATFVLGSQGIIFTPVSVPSHQPKESKLRILRDSGRSILWIITGRTGASLKTRQQNLYAFK
ncbi:YdcF family protein [Calothrix sp. UHCC 0171]|uniref:YdcF family protein n=1 Tax=Calothrix sp. UHCC 0171 TaxID=3110245 RepID=UPI002B2164B5|nr:YdcF family protein [Calothrix sp. UHCC 0171]MEA5570398.1 YdcF family protein [Calothrix sp. UHCC 0171]